MHTIYDPVTAISLGWMSAITYDQRTQNELDLDKIKAYYKKRLATKDLPPNEEAMLKGKQAALQGYQQVGAFTAPELSLRRPLDVQSVLKLRESGDLDDMLRNAGSALIDNVRDSIGRLIGLPRLNFVPFGFALEPADPDDRSRPNIIAIRGTGDVDEWITDATAIQVPYRWFSKGQGHVHSGFLWLDTILRPQIQKAVNAFQQPDLPLCVTGHSLGAALATLAAYGLALDDDVAPHVQMYNYASPMVGDADFAADYAVHVPNSYRVVNLADMVPMMPPTELKMYQHVGEEWAYLNQTNDLVGNHSIVDNYVDALTKRVPADTKRTYPISATN